MSHGTVALLHPGNMGVTIGAAAATSGARVVWVSHQRGEATRKRAGQAGLVDVGNLDDALRQSDIVLSVCPPHAAVDVAEQVAAQKVQRRLRRRQRGFARHSRADRRDCQPSRREFRRWRHHRFAG